MSTKGTFVKDVRKELRAIGMEARDEFLKLHGIDPEKAQALEKRVNSRYNALAGTVQAGLKEVGKKVADVHDWSHKRTIRLLQQQQTTSISALTARRIDWTLLPPCFPLSSATPRDHGDEKSSVVGPDIADVTYEASGNVAHPLVDVQGPGSGALSTATVRTWFDFSFMPSRTGRYCIRPLVYMNGHRFLWTWGTCGGSAVGFGTTRADLHVRVGQDMDWVTKLTRNTFDVSNSDGQDSETGFAYDSQVDGGAGLTVQLDGGVSATVRVECEIHAEVGNSGRAWVDMKSSPQFYFKVPEVWFGWSWWQWSLRELYAQEEFFRA